MRDEEQRYLESIARRLRDRHGLAVRTALLEDPVREALATYPKAEKIDVVVMTTHGRTGIADATVRESLVPVLMVRPSAKRARQRRSPALARVLVPLDGSSAAEAILSHTLALAGPDGGELFLIRVVGPVVIPVHPYAYAAPATRPDAEAIERLVTAASNYLDAVAERVRRTSDTLRVRTRVYVDRRPGNAIIDAATRYDARLIAMTTHAGRGSRLFVGGTADKVLRGTSVPILLCQPPPSSPRIPD